MWKKAQKDIVFYLQSCNMFEEQHSILQQILTLIISY